MMIVNDDHHETVLSIIDISRSINYKNVMIVNDTSRVVKMMPQLGASLLIVILTTVEVSFMVIMFL
jgi:hypothetical protein